MFDSFISDTRYAIRSLLRTPAFTIAGVLCLAIGIGANATMFGVVDTLLLRPPAGVRDPSSLVRVSGYARFEGPPVYGFSPSYADYLDLSRAPGLTDAAVYTPG